MENVCFVWKKISTFEHSQTTGRLTVGSSEALSRVSVNWVVWQRFLTGLTHRCENAPMVWKANSFSQNVLCSLALVDIKMHRGSNFNQKWTLWHKFFRDTLWQQCADWIAWTEAAVRRGGGQGAGAVIEVGGKEVRRRTMTTGNGEEQTINTLI